MGQETKGARTGRTALSPIALQIWDMKYRLKDGAGKPVDATVQATWKRVAKALAAAEKPARSVWPASGSSIQALAGFRFLPAGRILAGAGTSRNVTLFNCFVMGTVGDDMGDIFAHLREAALTMQGRRRHRLRLLHAAPEGRAGGGRRRRRLGPVVVHGRVGRDVPHDHERGHRGAAP